MCVIEVDPREIAMNRRRNVIGVGLFVLASFPVLIWVDGCVPLDARGGTVLVQLVPGQARSGDLFTGQTLRAIVSVEADHTYELRALVTPSTVAAAATGDVVGMISGEALAEPVQFFVSIVTGPGLAGSATTTVLTPVADGPVTIEFVYPVADTTGPDTENIDVVRALIQGPLHALFELSVADLGFDDHGQSPDTATALEVGIENERTGSLSPGDEADFFIVEVEAGRSYRVTVESTDAVTVVSGSEDRFGQINFGIPTLGGLVVTVSASAGVPGSSDFAAAATEQVILRVTPLGGAAVPADEETGINYAINTVEVVEDGS
jgi:hypothetical protein